MKDKSRVIMVILIAALFFSIGFAVGVSYAIHEIRAFAYDMLKDHISDDLINEMIRYGMQRMGII